MDRGAAHTKSPDELEIIDGACEQIVSLARDYDFVIVVTNQSVVGRGLISEETLQQINTKLIRQFFERTGKSIVRIYYCPHKPLDGCSCRKPQIGLFEQAAREFALDLSKCVYVGDKDSDEEAAKQVGCNFIRIRTNSTEMIVDALGRIRQEIDESIQVKTLLKSEVPIIEKVCNEIISCLSAGKKVLIFGNGGSAADSQHFAAELQGRYAIADRRALPAIALTTDTSILTAVGNDYGFEYVFSRQVEALAAAGDVVIGISTSGNSPNVLNGIQKANQIGALTIGLTGKDGGKLREVCNVCICVPSSITARIQESHLLIEHIISLLVERALSLNTSEYAEEIV